jgi:hypothetical protein
VANLAAQALAHALLARQAAREQPVPLFEVEWQHATSSG